MFNQLSNPKIRALQVLLAVLLVVTGCVEERAGRPEPTPTPSPREPSGKTCASPQDGYQVTYPDDWNVNDPEAGSACAWFHPEPFELPQNTEVTNIAIRIAVENVSFKEVSEGVTRGPDVKEVVSQREVSVADRNSLRAEVISSGEVLYPEGTLQTIWLVDWEENSLIASTTSVAEGEYSDNVKVIDRMMASVERLESQATCSAAALAPELPQQSGLPEAVADMRREIASAAVACDFNRLADLATDGSGEFTYSFGVQGDPAGYWRKLEEEPGSRPMLYLAGLLKRSYGRRDVSGGAHFIWPAAFTYEDWDGVPEEIKQELKPLYGEMEFSNFDRFGSYIGYRIGIDQSGNWLSFVAGD